MDSSFDVPTVNSFLGSSTLVRGRSTAFSPLCLVPDWAIRFTSNSWVSLSGDHVLAIVVISESRSALVGASILGEVTGFLVT